MYIKGAPGPGETAGKRRDYRLIEKLRIA